MEDFPYIEELFDAAKSGEFNKIMWIPADVPEEMQDPERPRGDDGYAGWLFIPSAVVDAELDELEAKYGITYPPIYRAFLKSYHFYDVPVFGIRFYRHVIREWKAELELYYEGNHSLLQQGLIPFGAESFMDAGAVCFDTRSPLPNRDCPVLYSDHEWVGTEKEICPMFSSGELMFASLAFAAYDGTNFVYHDPDEDSVAELAIKKRKMAMFLSIDPKGAGGIARDYWTTWGVNPDSE